MNGENVEIQIAELRGDMKLAAQRIETAAKSFERHIDGCGEAWKSLNAWKTDVDEDRNKTKGMITILYSLGGVVMFIWTLMQIIAMMRG